ncbi:MAG: anti-sigma factor RskA [Dehalococcoidia bacterium]|nr:anti-sigma factor RskA [Dehalococcoidia bacterium]
MDEHQELKELAAGYVLDCLEREERVAFGRHAASCRECAREVAELRAVLLAMPEIGEQTQEPPAELRQRIIQAARDDQTPPVRTARQRRLWPDFFSGASWSRSRLAIPLVLASVLVLVLAGVLNLRAQQRLTAREAELTDSYEALRIMAAADQKWQLFGSTDGQQAAGVLAYSAQKNASSMVLWGLPADEAHSYVAWTVKSGAKSRVGTMWRAEGGLWVLIPGDTSLIDGVGVTMRQADSPSGTQVAYFDLATLGQPLDSYSAD